MGQPLKVYTLGKSGVLLDPAPTDPSLPLDALTNAQNATHDPKESHLGALRKRAGLQRFNITTPGGPVLGGIGMLVAGTGGAPAQSQFPSVNDVTGSPVGAGAGTGAPGSSVNNSSSGPAGGGSSVPGAGAGLFGANATNYPGQRLMIVGRGNNFNPGGGNNLSDSNGWYIVRSDWNTGLAAKHQSPTPGPPDGYGPTGVIYPPTALFRALWGRPSVFDASTGMFFYALSHYRSNQSGSPNGSFSCVIRKTNGAVDSYVATIPGSGWVVSWMVLSDDGSALLVGSRSTSVANTGAMFRVDKSSGQTTPINYRTDQIFPGTPFCVETFNGKLWIGEWQQSGNEVGGNTGAQIDGTPAQDGSQLISIDHSFGFSSNPAVCTCLHAFPKNDPINQCLFAGFGVNGTSYAQVWVRQRTGIGDTGTPWAVSQTPSDTAAQAGNHFTSFVEFQGNLYASWRNGGTGKNAYIYKFVPTLTNLASDGGWNGTGTWTTVYGPIGQGTGQFAWNLYVDGPYMYAISGGETNISDNQAVITTDGSTWTDKSATIFDHGVNDDCPIGHVFFLNQ